MSSGNSIESVLQETRSFPPSAEFSAQANIKSQEEYQQMWQRAKDDPAGFWGDMAENLDWFKKYDTVLEGDMPDTKWFVGGKLNASYQCLDRHLDSWRKNKAAIIWEGEPGDVRVLRYQDLHREVCKFANVLKSLGVETGDRVTLYMPMIPELAIAMLACARIGAPHSIIFGGFSSEAIADRNNDAQAKVIVTADGGWRRGKVVPLKANVDGSLDKSPSVQKVVVVRRTGCDVDMVPDRDYWWHDLVEKASPDCDPVELDSEHPLFILYTSGSTGKPKGVLHTTAGYMLGTTMTSQWVFDLKEDDTYWCTADIGWVTGHSYIVYGPMANRAITMMYEGVPNYPDFGRFWQIVAKHKVNIFYTAPTALRALMKEGDAWPSAHDLSSLRLLGTVGEPIKKPEWNWYNTVIGKERCPIVDTWWQTETGGILITPLPGATPTKPGSATLPFFGVKPALVDDEGNVIEGNGVAGNLCILETWPGQMSTIYGDQQRFFDTYFSRFPGKYFSGDGCRRDDDGYYWITGRVDDIIIVSGHNLGTAEIEGAIGGHPAVAEAAVVGYEHDIKGNAIYAYVTLKTGQEVTDTMTAEIVKQVRADIGPHASPEKIQFTPSLPKTRSGKIMRRILRKIAEGQMDSLGDTSTLADPAVVESLVAGRIE